MKEWILETLSMGGMVFIFIFALIERPILSLISFLVFVIFGAIRVSLEHSKERRIFRK
jgi:hypothetical protein